MSEFRRGWRLLLGGFIGIATGVSSLYFYSLGLFLKPVAADLGWTRGEASLGPLVGTLAAAIAAAPTGRLMDRIGPLRTALAAMLLLAAGFAVLGVGTRGLGSFLLLTGVLSLFTVGSSPIAYTRLLVGGFDRHRGIALGLALTGTGVGATLMPVLLSPYIAANGWRAGYVLLAAVVLGAILPVGLLLRGTAPAIDRADLPPVAGIIRQPAFRLLGLTFFLAAAGVLGGIVHFPALLSDAGVPPARAGALAGLIGIAVIAGRAVAGLLLDRVPAWIVTAGLFALSSVGLLALAIGGAGMALPGALGLGLSVGAEVDLVAYLVSRMFAREAYGTAYGGIYALFLCGGAVGPAIVGGIYDISGGYAAPLTVAAACLLSAALLALRLDRCPVSTGRPWSRSSTRRNTGGAPRG